MPQWLYLFQIKFCNLDRTKSGFLASSWQVYIKNNFHQILSFNTRSYHPTDDMQKKKTPLSTHKQFIQGRYIPRGGIYILYILMSAKWRVVCLEWEAASQPSWIRSSVMSDETHLSIEGNKSSEWAAGGSMDNIKGFIHPSISHSCKASLKFVGGGGGWWMISKHYVWICTLLCILCLNVYVYLHVDMFVWVQVCVCVCVCVRACVRVCDVCLYVCLSIWVHAYIDMYRDFLSMHNVCMCACVYVFIKKVNMCDTPTPIKQNGNQRKSQSHMRIKKKSLIHL